MFHRVSLCDWSMLLVLCALSGCGTIMGTKFRVIQEPKDAPSWSTPMQIRHKVLYAGFKPYSTVVSYGDGRPLAAFSIDDEKTRPARVIVVGREADSWQELGSVEFEYGVLLGSIALAAGTDAWSLVCSYRNRVEILRPVPNSRDLKAVNVNDRSELRSGYSVSGGLQAYVDEKGRVHAYWEEGELVQIPWLFPDARPHRTFVAHASLGPEGPSPAKRILDLGAGWESRCDELIVERAGESASEISVLTSSSSDTILGSLLTYGRDSVKVKRYEHIVGRDRASLRKTVRFKAHQEKYRTFRGKGRVSYIAYAKGSWGDELDDLFVACYRRRRKTWSARLSAPAVPGGENCAPPWSTGPLPLLVTPITRGRVAVLWTIPGRMILYGATVDPAKRTITRWQLALPFWSQYTTAVALSDDRILIVEPEGQGLMDGVLAFP